ncbi:MAG TPA: NAD(P)-dependent oxidoreductase [Chloroflexi bacterium]|nr:NAD(P)-dependent oxidoreductase [Chloroflexota bacterium]
MVIVDTALEKRAEANKPVQVGIIGAGYMGRGVVLTIISAFKGMRVAAVYNRAISQAERAYRQAGVEELRHTETAAELEDAIANGQYAITDNPLTLCEAGNIDVIIEATGEVEFGARVVMRAIEQGKHVVLMNAELDATVGPILKEYADKAGVVITNADGDQPGVVMNLYRFVKTIGYNPVMCGNIKGLQDHYRTPETQAEFARKNKQKPRLITSFADGTKISMEMAVVANATGFGVSVRGMAGPRCRHVTEALDLFPLDQLLDGGLVDFILGAEPGPGVFVLGYNENPILQQYAHYFKMGDGPLYVFYVPYHLPHLEAPITAARAALFADAAVAPRGAPVCDVVTAAKRNLQAGELLDGIGGFTTYGMIDNYDVSRAGNFIPMGLTEGCRLKRDIAIDEIITYDDVILPEGRLADKLREEQTARFGQDRL